MGSVITGVGDELGVNNRRRPSCVTCACDHESGVNMRLKREQKRSWPTMKRLTSNQLHITFNAPSRGSGIQNSEAKRSGGYDWVRHRERGITRNVHSSGVTFQTHTYVLIIEGKAWRAIARGRIWRPSLRSKKAPVPQDPRDPNHPGVITECAVEAERERHRGNVRAPATLDVRTRAARWNVKCGSSTASGAKEYQQSHSSTPNPVKSVPSRVTCSTFVPREER
jgi:hypothetical protein